MTIQEILALPPEQRKAAYAVAGANRKDIYGNVIDISGVWIKLSKGDNDIADDFTDNDKFTDYGNYAFTWQKTLKESPERADNGSLPQLRNLAFFITGNLKIDYDLMPIDDYRRIMQLIYKGNCFKVKCYDLEFDRMIIIEMYFQPEELPKIFTMVERLHGVGASSEEWTDLIGIQSHTTQMVGTGNDNAQQRYFG